MHAAIYIRKSRKDKDKLGYRLALQREQLPTYAESQGWSFTLYDDGHASASAGKIPLLKERARLEADMRAGQVDIILVIELSRLSRDDSLQDYVALLHLCSSCGVKIATPGRTLDPRQENDWLLLIIDGGLSGVEMKRMASRMKEGKEKARLEGRFTGGTVPSPYIRDAATKNLLLDPKQLPLYQQIFKLGETSSVSYISKKTGLRKSKITRALADSRLDICQAIRRGPDDSVIQCSWEPCMTAEQAARIRANRQRWSTPADGVNRTQAKSLLTSLNIFRCGRCRSSIVSVKGNLRNDGSRYTWYRCKDCGKAMRHLPQPMINRLVIRELCRAYSRLEEIKSYWIAAQSGAAELKELDLAEASLTTKKERLIAAIAEGVINFADAKKQREQLEAEIKAVQKKRAEQWMLMNPPDWGSLSLSLEEFNLLPLDDQRQLIHHSIKKLIHNDDHLTLTFHFPIDSNGLREVRIALPPRRARDRIWCGFVADDV